MGYSSLPPDARESLGYERLLGVLRELEGEFVAVVVGYRDSTDRLIEIAGRLRPVRIESPGLATLRVGEDAEVALVRDRCTEMVLSTFEGNSYCQLSLSCGPSVYLVLGDPDSLGVDAEPGRG